MTAARKSSVLSLDELIALVRGGDVELYEEIVRRYQQQVSWIVSSLLDDHHAAEDLVQQVFVNAYVALPQFERGRDFGRWIRTIARNAVREELRRRSRYGHRLKVYYQTLAARLTDDDNASSYEESLGEALRECLERLSPDAAELVRQRYREGKDFDDLAARLGTSANAIRNRLCRARAKLRQCIERKLAQR